MKDKKLDLLKTFFTLFFSILTLTLFDYCGSSEDEEYELNLNEVSTENSNDESNNGNSDGETNSNLSEGIPSVKILTGALKTFVKGDEMDPKNQLNQDRITDNVWITRGNDGGQIYNAAKESSDDKTKSPIGTQWALGTLDKVNDLNFKNFRAAVSSPKNVVGKDLVVHLTDDDIYLSIKFKSWSQAKKGGFSYERSTK
tara:strand:+ start:142 stop:738 length:597 start_codon:yes stop_codon:yes gene_type:complete